MNHFVDASFLVPAFVSCQTDDGGGAGVGARARAIANIHSASEKNSALPMLTP